MTEEHHSPTKLRVLVVEDNPADQLLVRAALRSLDAPPVAVKCFARLGPALAELGKGTCDVVLLDLNLPDSWGLDTLRKVVEHAPDKPVVVLTGLPDEEFAIKSLKRGAQDYLIKGEWTPPLLNRTLRYAVERQRLMVENRKRALSLEQDFSFDEETGLYDIETFHAAANLQLRMAQQRSVSSALLLMRLSPGRFEADGPPDFVAKQVAKLLLSTFRIADILGRVSNCAFAVLAVGGEDDFKESRKVRHFVRQLQEFLASHPEEDITLQMGLAVQHAGDSGGNIQVLLDLAADASSLA